MSNFATDGSGAVADLLACRTLLSAFPSVLTGIITHLPTRALSVSDGPGRWTPQQVLAHDALAYVEIWGSDFKGLRTASRGGGKRDSFQSKSIRDSARAASVDV